jgi:hypothetical protein
MHHAPDFRIETISERGVRELISTIALRTLAREDIRYLDIGMPNDLLRDVRLLDTPGFADPFRDPERTLDVIESADVCIWCTLANQAWRRSEHRIWLSLPSRFRRSGILVVTRIDTLAHRGERLQVRARLEREAGALFGDIVLLSVPDAMRAVQADGRIADVDQWQDSGGSALIAALRKAAINYYESHGKEVSLAEVTETLWTGIEFTQTDSAVPSAAAHVTATPAVPETSDVPPASATEQELHDFLANVVEAVPACLAAAWIDLAGRRVLQFHGRDGGEIVATTALGEAIAGLFQGNNVRRIEELLKRSRGSLEDERHYFQEIVIIADSCIGVFLRHQSRVDRSLVVVGDRTVNLGMMLARARGLLESTDLLI